MRYLPLLAVVILVGCSAKIRTYNATTYHDDAFSTARMEQQGLAILPIVAGEGVEGYRRPFGQSLNIIASEYIDEGSLLTWQGTMDALNEAELVSEYNEAIAGYQRTSIIDRSLLVQMADATGMRYFLYVSLLPPLNTSSGTGFDTVVEIGVGAIGQIWDSEGDVVWEGAGSSEVRGGITAALNEESRSLSNHSAIAARALFMAILGYDPE